MSTKNQGINSTYKKQTKWKRPKFNKSPQRRGYIIRLRITTPRKPNSARRPTIKSRITTRKFLLAKIPGSPHNLRRFCKVLFRGVGYRDVPTVNYSAIRGILDLNPLYHKNRRRSVYGMTKPTE